MNRSVRTIYLLIFFLQAVCLSACENNVLKIEFNESFAKIEIEIADSHEERKKGLMFRNHLDPGTGMLFIYDYPQRVGFWMKNTKIPLDIVFANKRGVVVNISKNTEPLSTNLINGGNNIQYVLEINAGMSEQLNLFIGSRLVNPIINQNLKRVC